MIFIFTVIFVYNVAVSITECDAAVLWPLRLCTCALTQAYQQNKHMCSK
jgi:hypothetical protein